MRTLGVGVAALIALTGCGTRLYDVQPYGQDQFVIYSKSRDAADANSKSVEAANAYCAGKSKSMQPLKNHKVARRQFEFAFSCQ